MSEKSIDEIRGLISKEYDIPEQLLDGNTEEEITSRALALTAFKKERQKAEGLDSSNLEKKKSNADLFMEWMQKALPSRSIF